LIIIIAIYAYVVKSANKLLIFDLVLFNRIFVILERHRIASHFLKLLRNYWSTKLRHMPQQFVKYWTTKHHETWYSWVIPISALVRRTSLANRAFIQGMQYGATALAQSELWRSATELIGSGTLVMSVVRGTVERPGRRFRRLVAELVSRLMKDAVNRASRELCPPESDR